MSILHVTDAEFVNAPEAVLRRVQSGTEIVVERNAKPVAVIRGVVPPRRTISECVSLLPAESEATIDDEFAQDVATASDCLDRPLSGSQSALRCSSERQP